MVTRLSGGLTPANGADPRTFPAIWNSTAVDIETAEAEIDVLQASVAANGTAVTALQGSAVALGSAVATLEGSAVALGSAIDVIEAWDLDDLNDVTIGTAVADAQVLAYSTAVSGWVNANAVGGGKVLQVVTATDTTSRNTTSNTYVDITGLSVSITPTRSDSTIIVTSSVDLNISNATNNNVYGYFQLADSADVGLEGAEEILLGTENLTGTGTRAFYSHINAVAFAPATNTSARTYKARFRAGALFVTISVRNNVGTGRITAMEVAP